VNFTNSLSKLNINRFYRSIVLQNWPEYLRADHQRDASTAGTSWAAWRPIWLFGYFVQWDMQTCFFLCLYPVLLLPPRELLWPIVWSTRPTSSIRWAWLLIGYLA
ncbi:hypothetical protein TorRG33x02_259030, partial [Trema orientale]